MPASKTLFKLNPSLSSEESLYELLSYEAGFEITKEDLTLANITEFDTSGETTDKNFNTVITLNVNPTTPKFKHSESTVQRRLVRHSLEDYASKKSIELDLTDDLTLYDDEYALSKVNTVLGTNFTSEQVVIDFPISTRSYTPDSITLTFSLLENADIRFFGSLVFNITDSIDRRPAIDEIFTNNLLSGFDLP